MAGFVDCTKYNKEQDEQNTRIENLEKREIVHDETLKGGGIDAKSPLGLNTSSEKDNAIKTDNNGVYVKDLEPQVTKLEEALKNKYDRLNSDLEARIVELNAKLNNLKDIEVALAAAKAEGNYNKIKELEARLQAAKEAQQAGDKGLAEAIEALRKQGLSDAEIQKIIADAIAKAGGTGRYITNIVTNQDDGTVTYYYSDGTSTTGKLANLGGVVADQVTIVGNGHDTALSVQLSKNSDNKIRLADDGLYIGEQSIQTNYYVSTLQGDDSNVGTREKPMKTLQAVIDRIENISATYYIHLHENEEFDWVFSERPLIKVVLKAYGDTVDAQFPDETPNNIYYRGYCAKNYPRPTLNVRVRLRQFGASPVVARDRLICSSMKFQGLNLHIWNKYEGTDSNTISGHFDGIVFVDTYINVHGCVLRLKSKAVVLDQAGAYRDDVIFRGDVRWIDSKIEGEDVPWIASAYYTTQLALILWNSGALQGYGEKPDHESLIAKDDYATAGKGLASHLSGVIINDTDKYVLGMNFNYDVFTIK